MHSPESIAHSWIPPVTVPAGKKGAWEIAQFAITEQDAAFYNLRQALSVSSQVLGMRPVEPGNYTKLVRDGATIMSDTIAEKMDHLEAVKRGCGMGGNILINGLGLGMVLNACLQFKELGGGYAVNKALVVEKSADVIALSGKHYEQLYGERVVIVHADAFDYTPPRGVRFSMVWHDIWDTIDSDNLEGMRELHRKYSRKSVWQGSWARPECERMERIEN